MAKEQEKTKRTKLSRRLFISMLGATGIGLTVQRLFFPFNRSLEECSLEEALTAVIRVKSVKEMISLDVSTFLAGQQISIAAYHEESLNTVGGTSGGGIFVWDPKALKLMHNGGTVISPTVPWTWSDHGHSFLNGVGESNHAGRGAFVRLNDHDFLNVTTFGARRDVPATASFQKAMDTAKMQRPSHSIYIPAGVYLLGEMTLQPGVSLRGEDKNAVQLVPTTDDMTMFSLVFPTAGGANLTLSDFNIQCSKKTGVRGIYGRGVNTLNICNIAFYGCKRNFELDRGGWNRVLNCESSGNEVLPAGDFWVGSSDDDAYGNVFSVIENYQLRVGWTGMQDPACIFRRAVAIKITNLIASSSQYSGNAILIENDCQGLMFTDCSVVGFGIASLFRTGSGPSKAPIFNSFVNFEFDQNQVNAILLEGGRNNRFTNCAISSSYVATETQQIVVRTNANNIRFYHCHVTGYYTAPTGAAWLLDGCASIVIDGCVVSGSYQGVTASNHPSNCKIVNCDFSENIIYGITGDFTNNGNVIKNCFGPIPAVATPTAPAMPVSGNVIVNNWPVAVQVLITGGHMIGLILFGKSISHSGTAQVVLQPGESIGIKYTSAPTWTWVGMR